MLLDFRRSVPWALRTPKFLINGLDKPLSTLQATPRNMPEDGEIRLAVTELLYRLFRVIKDWVLVHAGASPKRHTTRKHPRISELGYPLYPLDRVVNGAAVGLNVLVMGAVQRRSKEVGIDT
jgi:hypothetical protein